MSIKVKTYGDLKKTKAFFKEAKEINPRFRRIMQRYGNKAVRALEKATPKDTGETASQWSFEVEPWGLSFYNANWVNEASVAILIQYGHATRAGTRIEGIDYINPALKPIFDTIQKELWKEVKSL
jgi:hypothetical protein